MSTKQQATIRIKEPAKNTILATSPQGYLFESGCAHPQGAIPDADGVNFSIYAEHAQGVSLLLFYSHDDEQPFYTYSLNPLVNKTFHFWHVYVRGLQPGTHYAYRVSGPAESDLHGKGERYNSDKVLLDPYAGGNTNALWKRVDACMPGDNVGTSMRSVVIYTAHYDWEGDQPLNRPMSETIIYEMHVRGFSRSPSSGIAGPEAGTFSGIIQKIPYLQQLGVTAIELLPVFDFDETEVKQYSPEGQPLRNYWGYDPFSFFCPQSWYCVSPEHGHHISEFRDMVKALHQAGIEVILDVVFNHTSEGNEQGPVINLKGYGNNTYYTLYPPDRQYYENFSGCGNTLNANHPVTARLIIDTLHFWVKEMHVDGFRFDEAVILCRDESGQPMLYPPVVWQIELSNLLADTKIIAEAWDAAGLYEVGYFPGYRWAEWNGRYRDTIRRFVRGDQGYVDGKTLVGRVADVIAGSADIFEANDELPINSVNFITCHDGFTLNDLVSYNEKHNEANGGDREGGPPVNLSWNCGIEGETTNNDVEALRDQQVKNFAAILLLSQGVPMFTAGDEVRRTQKGNNNAYCQDNEISWFDWSLLEKHSTVLRFFRQMIAFRKLHPIVRRNHFFTGKSNARNLPDISWHGCRLNSPGWYDPSSRVLAFTLGGLEFDDGTSDDVDIHVMLNMEFADLDFDVPVLSERHWYKVIDTAMPAPYDILDNLSEPGSANIIIGNDCHVKKHSVVALISFNPPKPGREKPLTLP